MSANIFDLQEQQEESFWPSFTDIMMVIVMVFLLVVVAVVLANTKLMEQLRSSVMAQQEASQLAEFTLQENATLEEQLDYYKRLVSATEMELLQSQAANERAQTELAGLRSELSRTREQVSSQSSTLQQREQQISTLQRDLGESSSESSRLRAELDEVRSALTASETLAAERETALQTLKQQTETDRARLASLEGDYAKLDEKYQKLLKPSRSAKNKTVVEVVYQRSGYRLKLPNTTTYQNVTVTSLESTLSELKAKYGTDLYVKIVIPDNSGLSYNEAWTFTRDMLNKYDYYYQADTSQPTTPPAGDSPPTERGHSGQLVFF